MLLMKWLVKKKCFNYYEYETQRNFEVEQVASTVSAYDGYIARIAFMPMEEGNCYRKSGFYVSFNGLEKVYKTRAQNFLKC